MTPINLPGGHGHVTPRADGLRARCGGPAICQVCAAEQAREQRQTARFIVHEAGELEPSGRQTCRRCGYVLLDPGPRVVDLEETWGFPIGHRVMQSPTCAYLVTNDRALANDEVSCR